MPSITLRAPNHTVTAVERVWITGSASILARKRQTRPNQGNGGNDPSLRSKDVFQLIRKII